MNETLPTARELEVLKVLWQLERATVREVYDALRPEEGTLAYTTVLSLLQIMQQKGLVGRESDERAHVFFPLAPKESTFQRLAGQFLDRVFDGAVDEYLVRALESRNVSDKDLAELEQRIAEARQRGREARKGKRT